ncbi:TonB-linked SusC/RagA family outer membrane protein [Lacibacter cauensis]|uniref:TonB-linked SusC/RagA family outer membrane protein n=1 Tax=Lacibacter cauensis TaxID=510947 RepID=A0A562SY73_9BACT|nr:SusC/RagA family TonB-linked outer membrane protein [Lacibacter cauensis]TWI85630.1 TonB-linked SusC/RagA family outer membrane protein [Lacibacter cauensis]
MIKKNVHSLVIAMLVAAALSTSQEVVAQQTNPTKKDSIPASQKIVITGKVTDAAGKKPLAGIRVEVKNFSAAITDDDGVFTLKVPSYYTDIEISGEGFASKQVSLKGKTSVAVSLLSESAVNFQEEVVMHFGTMRKRSITGAVTAFDANSDWGRPFETGDAALQGKVAGLNVIRRSGTPGIGANMFLRGYNSLYGSNAPLVVVDGIVYDMNDYGNSIIANNYTNPLALISIHDIDNYTVVKDATSMYGTKGANGAIIITTARAKKEATSIDFGMYTSYNQAPAPLNVMNASAYRTYLGDILQSKGVSSADLAAMPFMNDDTSSNVAYYRYHNNTNWQKNVLNNSVNQNYYLKVTGGDNIATYALTVGFSRNAGVIKNTDLTRYNTRFNAQFNFSKKFTGVASLAFTYNQANLKYQGVVNKTGALYTALTKSPFLAANEMNEKGVLSPNFEDTDILGISNPSVLIENMQAYNRYYRFMGSYTFKYDFNKYLSASSLLGIVYDKNRENIFVPRKGVADDTLSNAIADSRLGTQVRRLFSVYSDSRIEYKRTFQLRHSIASRLGLRYQQNRAEQDFTLGYNSATDELISVQNGVNALRQTGGGIGEWNWMNTYFNFDYGYKDKLFLSVNAAMDGSSRFGSKAKGGISMGGVTYAVMPSVAAAWILSSERFMATSSINLLKVRASFSLTGNDDIGNYTARQTYTSQNLLGMQGLVRSGIANPAIQWETNKKFNAGLDFATWNERLNVSVDVYRNKTDNMLVYEDVPAASGFSKVLTNGGSMLNTGIEASANARLVNKRKFKFDLGVTVAHNDNRVVAVPNREITTEYSGATILTRQGLRSTLYYGYIAQGVFSTEAEAAGAGLKKKNADGSYSYFKAGDVRFLDVNKDQIIDEKDRAIIGIPTPDIFGSITPRIEYGRFTLEALFTFAKGNDVFNYLRYKLESASTVENQLNSVVNRWRAEGQKTTMPKAAYGDPMGNNRFSTRWIEDGSYLRLRSATLAYNIPFKEKFFKNASIYVTGNNLFTLTNYSGYDPEFSASPSLFAQGTDIGLDPLFRSFILGARLGL